MRIVFFIIAALMVSGLAVSIFTTNRLTRFCLYTPLKVLVISLGIAALLWAVSGFLFDGADVKTYFEVNGKDLFLYPFFICFVCAVFSYSIFLCKIREIRYSKAMTFMCFIVVPLVAAGAFISVQNESEVQFLQTIYYSLAFIIPQSFFYIYFLRKQSKGEWDRDN